MCSHKKGDALKNAVISALFKASRTVLPIPTRSHQTVSKRFCLGGLARGIHSIRITLEILAIVIFVVILLSR